MRKISEICSMICLQREVIDKVLELDKKLDYSKLSLCLSKLLYRTSWDEGRNDLKAHLDDDPDGIKMLTCMLHCAEVSYEIYKAKGISDKIFIDTMKCFTRFIDECKSGYGVLKFDRDWWTSRQISLQLFRIGELEYEMREEAGKKFISIHIPSDAVFTEEKCRESYKMAEEFFEKFYPEYNNVDFVCSSWLLSPELGKLLPENSNILSFQKSFEIKSYGYTDMEFIWWVYRRNNTPYELLPEDTSLQKNMKKHLLNGGKIGSAYGILKK